MRVFNLSTRWWETFLIAAIAIALFTSRVSGIVFFVDLLIISLLIYLFYRLDRELSRKALHLREINARLNLANDLILVRDLDERITYWNCACQKVYGWTAQEAMGQPVHRLLRTEFLEPLSEIQNTFLQCDGWRGELVHYTKDNRRLIVSSTWSLHRDERGRPLANLEINKDITEAKLAEATLRKSERLYRTLVENFPNGAVFLFDGDLRYTIAAGTGLAAMSPRGEGLTGKSLWEAWDEEIAARLEPMYHEALAGRVVVTELSKGDRIYQVHVLPAIDDAGDVISGMMMVQEITERKKAAQALRSRAEQLTATTAILAETTARLEKRNQELDRFAYIVSHDLKAPLRAIANLSSWIEEDLEDRLNPDTQHQMNLLRSRVRRMEALIEGLLQYSRVGRSQTDAELVDVRELLDDIVDSLAPPAEIQIKIEPGMPVLSTERLPLAQVFSNLISNSIKHRDSPTGEVRIAVEEKEAFYEFTVADDGWGIDPQYHDKIFVMFQTLQPRDKVENTGVGLAIVKKIVEDKGGRIYLESQEGQGASFHFTWSKSPGA
jgi:PAS domain S-box-containing protein